jgi:hypothetical protein
LPTLVTRRTVTGPAPVRRSTTTPWIMLSIDTSSEASIAGPEKNMPLRLFDADRTPRAVIEFP